MICTSVARGVVLYHEMLREQVLHSDVADNLSVDDDRDGLTGKVIDVVAVLTRRRVGTGVHLDLRFGVWALRSDPARRDPARRKSV